MPLREDIDEYFACEVLPYALDKPFVTECREMYEKSPDPLTALMLKEPHIEPELLKHITIPVLITAGEHDLIKAEETRRIAESLQHQGFPPPAILPGSRKMPPR